MAKVKIGHIRVAAIIAVIAIILTAPGIIDRSLLGLLAAIYLVLGIAQAFLFAGSKGQNMQSGAWLFIISLVLFAILFLVYPMI